MAANLSRRGVGGALLSNDDAVAARWRTRLDRPSDATPMSQLQAATVLPQLDRLEDCNQLRAETINCMLNEIDWLASRSVVPQSLASKTFYKLAFLSPDRDFVLAQLGQKGIPCGPGYRSMHRSSDRRCRKVGPLRRSETLGEEVCLLDHSALLATGELRRQLIEQLREIDVPREC